MNKNRPWLQNYPGGVPVNIDPDEYCALSDFIDGAFKKYQKLPAFTCMGKTISYQELDKLSEKFGAYLHLRGLEPGDKIALMMPNLLQYPIAIFGALRAGLIIVNTNPLYTPREMLHQFRDSEVKAILIAENFAANLEKILPKTNINFVITTSIGELLGPLKGSLVNFVVRKIKRKVPKFNIPNIVSFKEAIRQGAKFTIKEFEKKPEDVIVLQYTGGTTGVSKGAMLTNRNLVANMLQIKAWLNPELVDKKEIALSPLPMYHIFAFSVNCLSLMSFGAHTILVTNARDLPSVVKEFKNYPISLMTGVNTLFNALLNNKKFNQLDFKSLKVSFGGGMAVQTSVAERWKALTGSDLTEGYGMTEASPVVTINPFKKCKLGSIGLPIPSTDIRIVGEDGKVVAQGEIGELQVKGPQVMKGYYNKPEETSNTLLDGWLCTGDMATMDEEGYFKIVDRKKDMIIVSGFNVYPNEIEDVLANHPKILEIAAIGIPDEKSGEVVKVFVVKKDKSLNEKELIQYCRENLTGYKIPKQVQFVKDLPKTNVGKILRRKLREL